MDSGIAGVRGSPASSTILPQGGSSKPAVQRPVTVDKQLVAQYIVDATSRTTYLKGRFLGKVNSLSLTVNLLINQLTNLEFIGLKASIPVSKSSVHWSNHWLTKEPTDCSWRTDGNELGIELINKTMLITRHKKKNKKKLAN